MNKLKSIFFPSFTETDAYALWISLLLPFLLGINDSSVMNEVEESFGNNILYLGGIFIIWSYFVIKILISKNTAKDNDKYSFALFFYWIIGFLTILSTLDLLFVTAGYFLTKTFIDKINYFLIFYLFLKSIASLLLLKGIRKENKYIITTQVDDEQAGFIELFLLSLIVIIFYFLFKSQYNMVTTILLTYFYSSSLIRLLKNIVKTLKTPST